MNMDDQIELIIATARGRGITYFKVPENTCICKRPYSCVLCNACGFFTRGRVRYFCPVHPKTIFLIDITGCPRCKAHEFMLTEV